MTYTELQDIQEYWCFQDGFWCYFLSHSSDNVPSIEEIFKEKLGLLEARNSSSDLENHLKIKEFRENVWNIHHEGQPLPIANKHRLEDEDIIMSQVN